MYQCDVDKLARESFITHIWSRDSISIHHLKVWFLDAQVNKNELVLLVAAANPNLNTQIQYALAALPLRANIAPTNFTSFCVLKFATSLTERADSADSSPPQCRFILNGPSAYLYSDKWILCVPSNDCPLEEPDRLDVRSPNESFLGAGVFGKRPLFFSSRHGVLILQSSAGDNQSFLDESISILEHSQVLNENIDTAQVRCNYIL